MLSRALVLLPLLVLLTGCASILALEPADDATNPACADVIVHLPDTVGGQAQRQTNAQATGAWGEPAGIILRCGVPPPAPTATLPCFTVDGIDWLRDDSGDPNFVFTTYGRTPAVEVIIDSDGSPAVENDGVSGIEALTDLSNAVASIPAESQCLSPEDVTE